MRTKSPEGMGDDDTDDLLGALTMLCVDAAVVAGHRVTLQDLEREVLRWALDRAGDNQSAAARLLGLSRYALRYRLQKHKLLARPSAPRVKRLADVRGCVHDPSAVVDGVCTACRDGGHNR